MVVGPVDTAPMSVVITAGCSIAVGSFLKIKKPVITGGNGAMWVLVTAVESALVFVVLGSSGRSRPLSDLSASSVSVLTPCLRNRCRARLLCQAKFFRHMGQVYDLSPKCSAM